jgi:uncharacterized protein (TIGR03437 family)
VNAAPLPVPLAAVRVFVAQTEVIPQYVSAAPGLIAGITQVNVQLPASTAVSGTKPVAISLNAANAALYVTQ